MNLINYIKSKEPDLFTYLPAEEIHPHDQFLARSVLKFLPGSVTPNQLTLLRIVMTPAVFLLTLTEHYRLGVILFILAAFTDALDGSLARTKNMITNFGMLFDPLADKLLVGSMVFLLVFENFGEALALIILGLELVMIVTALVAKYKFKTVKMANRWGKIKMLLQVIATSLTMIGLVANLPIFLTIAFWIFGLAIGFALISLFRQGI